MTPIAEITVADLVLPEGSKHAVYGADQTDVYIPLPAILTPNGKVVTQWEPTGEELQMLLEGKPITLVISTFGKPLQPVYLGVGVVDVEAL